MPTRSAFTTALTIAITAALGLAAPLAAQESRDPGFGAYDGAWEGEWVSDDTYRGEWSGTYTGNAHGKEAHHYNRRRFAYTLAERNQWLSDCQFLMADAGGFDDAGDENGARGGGLIGAIGGGIIGNRIAEDERLLGTVVGAGIGGLSGAAIGAALDSDGDGALSRNEVWAARYCDAYLRRHELGGGEFGHAQQAVLVPVSSGHRRGCGHCRSTVIIEEEILEIDAVEAHPRRGMRHVPHPAPDAAPAPTPHDAPRDKRIPAN